MRAALIDFVVAVGCCQSCTRKGEQCKPVRSGVLGDWMQKTLHGWPTALGDCSMPHEAKNQVTRMKSPRSGIQEGVVAVL